MPQEPLPPRVIDDLSCREAFANKFISSHFTDGVACLTFGVSRFTPDSLSEQPNVPLPFCVTARLALTPAAMVELANGLNSLLNAIQGAQQQAGQQSPQALN